MKSSGSPLPPPTPPFFTIGTYGDNTAPSRDRSAQSANATRPSPVSPQKNGPPENPLMATSQQNLHHDPTIGKQNRKSITRSRNEQMPSNICISDQECKMIMENKSSSTATGRPKLTSSKSSPDLTRKIDSAKTILRQTRTSFPALLSKPLEKDSALTSAEVALNENYVDQLMAFGKDDGDKSTSKSPHQEPQRKQSSIIIPSETLSKRDSMTSSDSSLDRTTSIQIRRPWNQPKGSRTVSDSDLRSQDANTLVIPRTQSGSVMSLKISAGETLANFSPPSQKSSTASSPRSPSVASESLPPDFPVSTPNSSHTSPLMFGRSQSLSKEGEVWSILQNAGVSGNVVEQVTCALDRHQVDVNCLRGGYTPLLWTCWKIHGPLTVPLVKLLIQHGAMPNTKDDCGWNALHYVCRYHSFESLRQLVLILLDAGVDVNARTPSGFNALHLACCYQTGENLEGVIRLMLERKVVDVNAKTNKGFTALHLLCRNYPNPNLKQLVELLLNNDANVNAINRDSWTAMHFLCRFYPYENLTDIIRLMAERDVDHKVLKIRNSNGQNALECCLLNPAGQFHTIFDLIKEDRQKYNFAPVWRAGSLLDLANIGCIPMIKWILTQSMKTYNVVDAHGKNCVDYLQIVCGNSLVLCRKCLMATDRNDKVDLADLQRLLASRENLYMPFPPFVREELIVRMSEHSDITVSKEKSFISFPEYESWTQLAQSWVQGGRIEFKAIERYVRRNSHMNCTGDSNSCRWCRVAEDVRGYLQSLMNQTKILDERLESDYLIGYGSAAESTKLFLPDEFDYAVVLKNFQQSNLDVRFRGKPENASAFYFNGDTRMTVNSGRLLSYYGLLIEEAIRRVAWHRHIFHPRTTISETCVTLIFYYRSEGYQGHEVSVDLTLAVPAVNWKPGTMPEEKELPTWCHNPANPDGKRHFIVPHRSPESGGKWQLSTFTIERDVFLHADCRTVVAHVLRLLKLMVSLNQVSPNERKLCRKSYPSSYALKTCLFRYMVDHPPPWDMNDTLAHCRGVLKVFPLNENELISFFTDNVSVYHIAYQSKEAVDRIMQRLSQCAI